MGRAGRDVSPRPTTPPWRWRWSTGRTSWCALVCWGFALTCRLRVLLFGASIGGSLWYGDLPALDGARDDRHSRTFSWRARRRPQHLKEPSLLERCCMSWGLLCLSLIASPARSILSSTHASHLSPCLGLSRTGSSSGPGCQEGLRARRSGLTHAPCGRLWPLLSGGSPGSVASTDEGVRPGLRVRARWFDPFRSRRRAEA